MAKESLKTLGDNLKQKRKERNLSLREVENATSIRVNYLQAIEDGDLSKLISAVYAQGFVRQYATFLGVDGELFIRENPDIFNRHEKQEFSYGIGTLEKRGNPGAGVKWVPNALWVGAFILVLVLAWYFARFLQVI